MSGWVHWMEREQMRQKAFARTQTNFWRQLKEKDDREREERFQEYERQKRERENEEAEKKRKEQEQQQELKKLLESQM